MDVRLTKNNVYRDDSGSYVYIYGLEELCQRVRIACSIPRGSFVYNRELGIDLTDLTPDRETLADRLDMRVKEACVNIPDASVRVESVTRSGSEFSAVISVSDGTQTTTTEVTYNGIV